MNKDTVMFLSGFFLMFALWALVPEVIFAVGADTAGVENNGNWTGMGYIAAALAVGLACMASAYAVARIGSAGLGAVSEKPELAGRALIFLGLAEGIAIYGLIIAIMILNKI
jgi:V/A-type H+-transporting ATPase subunit K